MAVGQFLNITNYRMFENITRDIVQMADADPAMVFQTATPGFLQNVFQDIGPWRNREQKAFEFPGALEGGLAVASNERARMGGIQNQQVVAQPGFEIAGRTQTVTPSDFLYGGMSQAAVTQRAMRPRLDWNKAVFTIALDVATQGGASTGAPIEEFAYTVKDQAGNTATKSLITESANETADVIANSTQSITWPLRTGGVTGTGHDHNLTGGGAWTLALARTARDLVLEHPGNGTTVDAYVGKTVAEAIRTVLKSELGAVVTRDEFIKLNIAGAGGLAGATPVAMGLEGVNYYFSPDMDVNQGLFVAQGKKPFYFSKGNLGVDGNDVSTGYWTEQENVETKGSKYGFRSWANLGVLDGTAAVIEDFV